MSKPLPPALVGPLWDHVAAIRGVSLDAAATTEPTLPGTANEILSIRLRGWSPSLHAIRIVAVLEIDRTLDFHERSSEVLERLAGVLDRQRRRAEDAAALGIALPLPIDGIMTEVGHLHLDVTAAANLMGQDEQSPLALSATVAKRIARLHAAAESKEYSGGASLEEDDRMMHVAALCEIDPAAAPVRYVTADSMFVQGNNTVTLQTRSDGTARIVASLAEHPPATAVAAISGRPLGDLFDFGTLPGTPLTQANVHRRIVTDARLQGITLTLDLAPASVAIRDLFGQDADVEQRLAAALADSAKRYGASAAYTDAVARSRADAA